MKTLLMIAFGIVLLYLPGKDLFEKDSSNTPVIESKKIGQVAIVVEDIEASGKLWAEVLGLDEPEAFVSVSHPERPTTFNGEVTHAEAKLAFLKLENLEIELIQPMGEGSTWQEFLDTHGEGIHHFAFWVEDKEGIAKKLSTMGMPTVQTGGWETGGYTYVDARDALGAIVELLENYE
ncbi:VOC family protein [Pleomorphovibrio marinus]|uniref:VOC family protein n=1 Tax=Pleomorphovibrio marinus TaxID=2164132 RepID=UPI000E0BFE8B|nr:VOC family protein [Pleomorphovibrio marinus]